MEHQNDKAISEMTSIAVIESKVKKEKKKY